MATRERDVEAKQSGLEFRRYFTRDEVHPFDEVEWEVRDAVIPNFKDGGNAFEQRGVEFPKQWSQNANNIVAQKYFRGPLGSPERESSVRQLVGRVVDTVRGWGEKDRYFATVKDAQIFADELTHLLVTQTVGRVEERLRRRGPVVTTQEVGLEVLTQLAKLDQVGYMRFASVYKDFQEAGDFERELGLLVKRSPAKRRRG